METRAAKRKRLVLEAENESKDRTRDLPDPILHQVLSFLPVQSIAQTSVVSKRWARLWRSHPCLDFTTVRPPIILDIVTTVLSRRHEDFSIKIFRLSGTSASSTCLSDCLHLVVKHGIEELVLDVCLADNFQIPQCLFGCKTLRVFKLSTGIQYSPNNFVWFSNGAKGLPCLRSLHTLSLTCTFITGAHELFSATNFPLLKSLHLEDCLGMVDLNIDCPSLEDLQLHGLRLSGLGISCARLEELRVTNCFKSGRDGMWVKICSPRVRSCYWEYNALPDTCSIDRFDSLQKGWIIFLPERLNAATLKTAFSLVLAFSCPESLMVSSSGLQLMSNIDFAGGPQASFSNLRTLELRTALDKDLIPGILSLLRISPILRNLAIIVDNDLWKWKGVDLWNNSNFTEDQYRESQAQVFESLHHHLLVVKIDFKGTAIQETAVNLVKFLLGHGKVLQEMTLSSESNNKDSSLWKQIGSAIMEFPKASSDVKISIL